VRLLLLLCATRKQLQQQQQLSIRASRSNSVQPLTSVRRIISLQHSREMGCCVRLSLLPVMAVFFSVLAYRVTAGELNT